MSSLLTSTMCILGCTFVLFYFSNFSFPLSLSSLPLLISWAIAPFLTICLFSLLPFLFPPSLPHSHLHTVPVTYAWRDELIRKAEKAISKALGKDKPSTSMSALSSRQSSRGAPRQFDHLDDQSVSIYIHVHSYSYVHVPRNVHIMPQSGCVACVTN